MHLPIRFSIWPALACCAFFRPAYAQDPTFTGTVTVGAGGNFVAAGYEALQDYSNAPTFSGELELRLHRYVAVDLGVENALPIYTRYGGDGYFNQSRQVDTFLPFGARGILPVVKGRLEPYVGFGGLRFGTVRTKSTFSLSTDGCGS